MKACYEINIMDHQTGKKNRWVKSAKETDRRYFDGNYWQTQHWLISSRNPFQSFSRDAKNTHKYKMPNQPASQGEARTKEEKSQHARGSL